MSTCNQNARNAIDSASAVTDDRGLSTVEYVVLLVLIVGAVIGLWVNIGQDVRDRLTKVHSSLAAVDYGGGVAPISGSTGNSSLASPPVAVVPAAVTPASPAPAPVPAGEGTPTKAKEDR